MMAGIFDLHNPRAKPEGYHEDQSAAHAQSGGPRPPRRNTPPHPPRQFAASPLSDSQLICRKLEPVCHKIQKRNGHHTMVQSDGSNHHLYDFNSAAGSINSHGHPPTFHKDEEEEEYVS